MCIKHTHMHIYIYICDRNNIRAGNAPMGGRGGGEAGGQPGAGW